jgi:hypothetical protein
MIREYINVEELEDALIVIALILAMVLGSALASLVCQIV